MNDDVIEDVVCLESGSEEAVMNAASPDPLSDHDQEGKTYSSEELVKQYQEQMAKQQEQAKPNRAFRRRLEHMTLGANSRTLRKKPARSRT